VKAAIAGSDRGLFPGAFCKAVPDVFTGSPEHCVVLHADGAGTKSALAYVHYRKHEDPAIFRGIAQDALVMNLDDILCVGATGPYLFSNTIGRNARLIDRHVLREIINGYEALSARLRTFGVDIQACGGETADLGDIVRTLVVDATLVARMRRDEFINCQSIRPGHVIIGLASYGQAAYEDSYNSGIAANGFTAVRHELLSTRYHEKFPETYAPEISDLAYTGAYDIDDPLPGTALSLGDALLSPTRTFAPILLPVFAKYRSRISGIFHNTGGGQTKCLNFGTDVHYEKTDVIDVPPIFQFVREVTRLSPSEMLRTFNMGTLMEIVCESSASSGIIEIAKSFGVEARIVGHVAPSTEGRSLTIVLDGVRYDFKAST
jgi:phosphoribosylformylglycinamidine cyclo-ligase